MEAVFGLVEDDGPAAFDDGIGNLFAAFGGEAMHEDGAGAGLIEEGVVDLIIAEGVAAFDRFLLLAHAGPDVGIDGVGAIDGFGGVVGDEEGGSGDSGQAFRLPDDLGIWGVAGRAGEGEIHAEAGGGEHERLGHVVAIADEGELEALQDAEAFADGLHVGEGLAGMIGVAEGVDDGNGGPVGEAFDGGLREDAGDDAIDPAIEVAATSLRGSRTPMGPSRATEPPPNCLMAGSKVRRVRREGFSKRRAMDWLSRAWAKSLGARST